MAESRHDFEVLFTKIEDKTNKSMREIIDCAIENKMTKPNVKAAVFYNWINETFGLGRGYAQAIWINFEDLSKRKNG